MWRFFSKSRWCDWDIWPLHTPYSVRTFAKSIRFEKLHPLWEAACAAISETFPTSLHRDFRGEGEGGALLGFLSGPLSSLGEVYGFSESQVGRFEPYFAEGGVRVDGVSKRFYRQFIFNAHGNFGNHVARFVSNHEGAVDLPRLWICHELGKPFFVPDRFCFSECPERECGRDGIKPFFACFFQGITDRSDFRVGENHCRNPVVVHPFFLAEHVMDGNDRLMGGGVCQHRFSRYVSDRINVSGLCLERIVYFDKATRIGCDECVLQTEFVCVRGSSDTHEESIPFHFCSVGKEAKDAVSGFFHPLHFHVCHEFDPSLPECIFKK